MLLRMERQHADSLLERRADQVEQSKRLEGYVRLDVYAAQQQTDAVLSRGLESELHATRKTLESHVAATKENFQALDNRKRTQWALVVTALIAPVLLILFTAYINGGAP